LATNPGELTPSRLFFPIVEFLEFIDTARAIAAGQPIEPGKSSDYPGQQHFRHSRCLDLARQHAECTLTLCQVFVLGLETRL
jgi:hypothetical protein